MNWYKNRLKQAIYLCGLVVLITVNSSCKKGKANFDLHGVIVDQTFSNGLAGATVSLYEVDASGSNVLLLDETTTSSDRAYSFLSLEIPC